MDWMTQEAVKESPEIVQNYIAELEAQCELYRAKQDDIERLVEKYEKQELDRSGLTRVKWYEPERVGRFGIDAVSTFIPDNAIIEVEHPTLNSVQILTPYSERRRNKEYVIAISPITGKMDAVQGRHQTWIITELKDVV